MAQAVSPEMVLGNDLEAVQGDALGRELEAGMNDVAALILLIVLFACEHL